MVKASGFPYLDNTSSAFATNNQSKLIMLFVCLDSELRLSQCINYVKLLWEEYIESDI